MGERERKGKEGLYPNEYVRIQVKSITKRPQTPAQTLHLTQINYLRFAK